MNGMTGKPANIGATMKTNARRQLRSPKMADGCGEGEENQQLARREDRGGSAA
jgi:hypothetical protein